MPNAQVNSASAGWSSTQLSGASLPSRETEGLLLGTARIICFCNHIEGISNHIPFIPEKYLSPEQVKVYYEARIADRDQFCGYAKANAARRLARSAAIEFAARVLGRSDPGQTSKPATSDAHYLRLAHKAHEARILCSPSRMEATRF